MPFSLQCRHLPQHLYQFLSHHRPLKLEERLKVQEALATTHREKKEVLTGVKQRYAQSVIPHLQSFRELLKFVHLSNFFQLKMSLLNYMYCSELIHFLEGRAGLFKA